MASPTAHSTDAGLVFSDRNPLRKPLRGDANPLRTQQVALRSSPSITPSASASLPGRVMPGVPSREQTQGFRAQLAERATGVRRVSVQGGSGLVFSSSCVPTSPVSSESAAEKSSTQNISQLSEQIEALATYVRVTFRVLADRLEGLSEQLDKVSAQVGDLTAGSLPTTQAVDGTSSRIAGAPTPEKGISVF